MPVAMAMAPVNASAATLMWMGSTNTVPIPLALWDAHSAGRAAEMTFTPKAATAMLATLGPGLPFTRPLGFDEAFDYTIDLYDVSKSYGTARMLLDRPFNGRLPTMHWLDLSLERSFDLSFGKLQL